MAFTDAGRRRHAPDGSFARDRDGIGRPGRRIDDEGTPCGERNEAHRDAHGGEGCGPPSAACRHHFAVGQFHESGQRTEGFEGVPGLREFHQCGGMTRVGLQPELQLTTLAVGQTAVETGQPDGGIGIHLGSRPEPHDLGHRGLSHATGAPANRSAGRPPLQVPACVSRRRADPSRRASRRCSR